MIVTYIYYVWNTNLFAMEKYDYDCEQDVSFEELIAIQKEEIEARYDPLYD